MKKALITLLLLGFFLVNFFLFSAFSSPKESNHILNTSQINDPGMDLKKKVFEILKTKCNVCHRKQNPFKVFSLKNMEKNAPKIYKQVFVYRRMPKGDQIQLTNEEYQTLNKWLKLKNIY